jgi:hypothetical protein
MTKPDRDPGRGQLHKRSARAWRDEANPTGPGVANDEAELEPEAGAAPDEAPEQRLVQEPVNADESVNAGPGGGGATESAPGDRQHGAQHGGPSHKS